MARSPSQVILLLYVFLVLGISTFWSLPPTVVAQGTDLHDAEVQLRKDLFRGYDKHILPPHNASSPVQITMGMTLLMLQNVNPQAQILKSEGWLKLSWNESRLRWNEADYNGLNVIHLPVDTIWTPDIRIYNSDHLSFKESLGILSSTGSVVWVPAVSMSTYCHFVIKHYPYDTHECSYKFGSWTHDGFHVDLGLYKNDTSIDLSALYDEGGEWEVIGSSAARNEVYYSCCPQPYVDVTYNVTIRRRSPYHKAGIVCPLVANVFLILVSLWITPLSYHRITLNVVSFVTLVWILLHLVDKVPAVGIGVPLIMVVCDILIVLSVIVLALSVWFLSVLKSKGNQPAPNWMIALLDSRLAKILRVRAPKSFARFSNDEPPSTENEEPQKFTTYQSSSDNPWIYFFQILDRSFFIVCIIVLTSFIIAVAF